MDNSICPISSLLVSALTFGNNAHKRVSSMKGGGGGARWYKKGGAIKTFCINNFYTIVVAYSINCHFELEL